jgi:hypothetical protein
MIYDYVLKVGGLGIGMFLASILGGCGSSKSTSSTNLGTTGGTSGGGVASTSGGSSAKAGNGGASSGAGGASTGGAAATTGGSTGTGGTGTGGGDPCAPAAPCSTTPTTCTAVAPTNALITDWADLNPANSGFVDSDHFSTAANWWTAFFGGPYVYPANAQCSAVPLSQTITAHSWHITGAVGDAAGDYSGFGLWFSPCMANFSAYGGISFTISGSAGSTGRVRLAVRSSSNSVHSAAVCNSNVGTCVATDASTCADASANITLTSTPATVTLRWSDFTGGFPSTNPNPAEITSMEFQLPDPYTYPWDNDAGAVVRTLSNPYNVDITVGDITLVP